MRAATLTGRILVIATASAFCAGAAMAAAAESGDRGAYAAAMKCYVANSSAASQRTQQGDTAKAAVYRANAKRAFDGAMKLGRTMGLSNRQMNGDLDETEARELSRMVADAGYFRSAVATCKGLGLM